MAVSDEVMGMVQRHQQQQQQQQQLRQQQSPRLPSLPSQRESGTESILASNKGSPGLGLGLGSEPSLGPRASTVSFRGSVMGGGSVTERGGSITERGGGSVTESVTTSRAYLRLPDRERVIRQVSSHDLRSYPIVYLYIPTLYHICYVPYIIMFSYHNSVCPTSVCPTSVCPTSFMLGPIWRSYLCPQCERFCRFEIGGRKTIKRSSSLSGQAQTTTTTESEGRRQRQKIIGQKDGR